MLGRLRTLHLRDEVRADGRIMEITVNAERWRRDLFWGVHRGQKMVSTPNVEKENPIG